jgi:hypothetical protein
MQGMTKAGSLSDLLSSAPKREHIVDFYSDAARLADSVADFAEAGLRCEEAVLLIAEPENLERFRRALAARDLAVIPLERTGQLRCIEAREALDDFWMDGKLYWARFEASIGATLHGLFRGHKRVRAYGEMVDVLRRQGFLDAALELESFWNRISIDYPFCLFCAYFLDLLDPTCSAASFAPIYKAHTHSFAENLDHENILQRAISEVVEPRALEPLQAVLTAPDNASVPHLSPALKTLLWLKAEMPQIADQVVSRARAYQSPKATK